MLKAIKRGLFALLLLSSVFRGGPAQAATYTAASCNVSDVQVGINSASNGDIVIIPNGSCTWASGISTSKQITLQGASVGGVVITDGAGASDLLTFTIGSSFRTTIANLNFLPGTGTGNYITVNGIGMAPLMHDCVFNLPNFQLQHAVQWLVTGGVIWNTTFESTTNLGGACGTQVGSDSGSLLVKSNVSWDVPSTMGTLDVNGDQNLYIEDSTFSTVGQIPDVDDNGRVVIRNSQIIGSSGLTHGVSSAAGGRQVELYNNTFSYPNTNRNLNRYFWLRAGTMVVTNNSIQALSGPCYGNKNSFTFVVEGVRWNAAGHGCCTGWMCFHQAGSGASSAVQSPAKISSGQAQENFQISDPIYIWNNTGSGQGSAHIGFNDSSVDNCSNTNPVTGAEYTTADMFVRNRDYFADDSSNANSGAKPGWVPYIYPHPFRTGASGSVPPGPAAPTGLQSTVR